MSGLKNTYLLTFDDLQDYINKLLQEYSRHEVVKIVYLMQKAFQFPAKWVPLISCGNVPKATKVFMLKSRGLESLKTAEDKLTLMVNVLLKYPWLQDSEATAFAPEYLSEYITCKHTKLSNSQLKVVAGWGLEYYDVLTLVDVVKYSTEDYNHLTDNVFWAWLGVVCSYMPLPEMWNEDELELLTETPATRTFLDNLVNVPYSNERYGSKEQENA